MNILFISNDPTLFDAMSASRARMRLYATHCDELHIISRGYRGSRHQIDGNLHLYPVRVPRFLAAPALTLLAPRIVRKKNIAIVAAQDPFEFGTTAYLATRGSRAKLYLQVHTDFLSPWFVRTGNWRSPQVALPIVVNRIRRALADYVLPRADGIRVVSERIKGSLVARYGTRIAEPMVIPVAVAQEVPPAVPLPQRPFTFTLMAVGRLEPEKRVEDILAALALVVPHYPSVGLVVAGGGRERSRLERRARKLGLRNHVLFLGDRPDAWGLLENAQAFIQASAYEGYGRTLIEAALAKVPIITTDVGIVGEVFKGYGDVLAVPVADPTALSLSIVGLLEDSSARVELPLHAEAAARAHLSAVGNIPERIAADLARVSQLP